MNPEIHAKKNPDKPAYILTGSGRVVTFGELAERSNQGANLFHSLGLQRGDHIALCMENNAEFLIVAWAAQRAGLYYTPISSRLTPPEVEYIIEDCEAKVFITSEVKSKIAEALAGKCPNLVARYMVGKPSPGYESWEDALAAQPSTPPENELEGNSMLYSSGTTGHPKGVKLPLPDKPLTKPTGIMKIVGGVYKVNEDSIFLSPAPMYHGAPFGFTMAALRLGATVLIMEHFDALESLKVIEKYKVTHSQWVPTMFVRMLKLPREQRDAINVSSMEMAVHAAAPCPIPVKEAMIEWWGRIIYEYYGGSEGNGLCVINSEEWLAHKGSVGRPINAKLRILDEEFNEVPAGQEGTIYFESPAKFKYHNDPDKTAGSRSPQGYSTIGDVGYVDEEGWLYLTDRKAHMIISGGVNIYPQETENALIMHPKVADAAVIGVPNEEFGEEVKAVVQLEDMSLAGPELARELIDFCRERIADVKCPRSIDFEPELPRHPTGKLYKRLLKDRYWGDRSSRII
ncbi:MAG: acyl-CoA synthetase [Chrysiogenetes bacterium]|nr:acyl-CoA synthetase [Chrysiogenetes bacterium]